MNERARPQAPFLAKFIFFFLLVVLYLPVLMMMANSFLMKVGDQTQFTLSWYTSIFNDREIIEALIRTLWVAGASATGAALLGSLAALALSKTEFQFKKTLTSMSFISLVVPELVFALSLLSWFFILGFSLSLTTVILSHITFSVCFVLMTVLARTEAFDPSIEDAARDLGASDWVLLQKIWWPLMRPAVLAGLLLGFLLSFDDFLISFYMNGVGSDTLPIRLYVAMRLGLSPKLSALATLMFFISFLLIFGLMKSKSSRAIA